MRQISASLRGNQDSKKVGGWSITVDFKEKGFYSSYTPLNGTRIGFLSKGRNNGLNAGDVFTLDPLLQVVGENRIEFRQRVAGWKWGVTSLAVLTPPPPPPVIELSVGSFDTGQYGYNYGTSEHETSLVATFQGNGASAYELQVAGYDVDYTDEVSVYLNDTLIGYLSKGGKNNRLNAGDMFMLDPLLLEFGENRIEFRQRVAGWMWGVTNLGIFDFGVP